MICNGSWFECSLHETNQLDCCCSKYNNYIFSFLLVPGTVVVYSRLNMTEKEVINYFFALLYFMYL